ncbi:hypothetical protein BCV69DRAFT_281058 [Microstroma glucosiphilum]|uniref:Uncharacterized protein n=1 Tax=Pseudomicrostroma glucosiphilum TaxID=1684307 RepID=A0A316UE06_9BASI|nr:hypothetical protein BCV69DRAFT_281058 [Pseudomicrostroma glucosiphilum]PWN23440.1 hypothetical protein BCV69DRAFT_281058 [Pseudomicrostroma glucosiphilum]
MSSSPTPVRFLSSSSVPSTPASYLPEPTQPFAPPNYLSHPTHTVSSLLLQEAIYAGIPSQVFLLPSTVQQARPHTRLVSRKRKSKKKKSQGMQGLSLEEEFPSDEDEEEEEAQDEVDPAPLQVDLVGSKAKGGTGPPMAAFVESRRKVAARRRAVASGMYV